MNVTTKGVFTAECGAKLHVLSGKGKIVFELHGDDNTQYHGQLRFSKKEFDNFYAWTESVARTTWKDFFPKSATSAASDYDEYYDKELDNNGGIAIKETGLYISRPSLMEPRFFIFTKAKMQSFLFDLDRMVIR
jgi:hypothetical protein